MELLSLLDEHQSTQGCTPEHCTEAGDTLRNDTLRTTIQVLTKCQAHLLQSHHRLWILPAGLEIHEYRQRPGYAPENITISVLAHALQNLALYHQKLIVHGPRTVSLITPPM